MADVYKYYKSDCFVVKSRFYYVIMIYLLDVYNKDDNDLLYSSRWSFLIKEKKINVHDDDDL